MNHKKILQEKFSPLVKNKKVFYSILAAVLLVIIIAGVLIMRAENNQRFLKEKAKEALIEKQAAEQAAIQTRKATINRATFFLQAPAGARGGINISNYWEGSYRIPDTIGKKMTVLYIKNPDFQAPLMYIRYEAKKSFKLESGETELKTDSRDYAYAYYFYPEDSYAGADKENFIAIQKDFEADIKTFSIF
jgi:hypothetical protein